MLATVFLAQNKFVFKNYESSTLQLIFHSFSFDKTKSTHNYFLVFILLKNVKNKII